MALSCLIMQRLHSPAPSTALMQSLLTELHSSVHFLSIRTALSPRRIAVRAVSLDGTFGVTDHDVFICTSSVINGNLAGCYFSEVVCEGGKRSSPCEIGSRESSADQPVCRLWEDILYPAGLWLSILYSTNGAGQSRVRSVNGFLAAS